MKAFHNPLAAFDSPDPFMTYDANTGYYYCLLHAAPVWKSSAAVMRDQSFPMEIPR